MNECYMMKLLMKSKKRTLRKSAHLEAVKEYEWMLCGETLDEIKEQKTLRKSPHLEAMKEYEWMLCDETLDEI